MPKQVTLTIDQQVVSVPEGTLIVNAARMADIHIPVFCYHPKLEPVGMCRMCLVEVGRPAIDPATKQLFLEADGKPKIQFGPKLETSCTTPVSEGMVVLTSNEKVKAARKEVVEFILTSHPLDCPICDKGGECPLQNLTMMDGASRSRFAFDEKMHLQKHVPLGELIWLDRERCIQCGRCVRFQKELVDDPVIGFYQRGRSLEIVTQSTPGFDSIWSGNTSDICPVGALTTADFRFGARPWEMKAAASICTLCPVGCNIDFNVRREVKSGGQAVIKRVMPRQNEYVNEIWICDKGRFGYHFTESDQRVTKPLARKNGKLVPISWDDALNLAGTMLKNAGNHMVTVASGNLSNEDYYNLAKLTEARHGKLRLLSMMAGGDVTAQVGMAKDSQISELGKGSVIVVVASDLHEEAPLWWLRIKQAVSRGAILISVQPRRSRLSKYAKYVVQYAYGEEAATIRSLLPDGKEAKGEAAQAIASAENLVVFMGYEGTTLASSSALADACGDLIVASGHAGKRNSGLIGVWPEGNMQGAWDMGFRPSADLAKEIKEAKVVYVIGCNPAGDSPELGEAFRAGAYVIAQDIFLNGTTKWADLVLPAQTFTEREGTLTNGERRIQRYYPAVTPLPVTKPDYAITSDVAQKLEIELEGQYPALILKKITAEFPAYSGVTYAGLADSPVQFPLLDRKDLYYGGTSYENKQGIGISLGCTVENGAVWLPKKSKHLSGFKQKNGDLLLVMTSRLYDQGVVMRTSPQLATRMAKTVLAINPHTAEKLGVAEGEKLTIKILDTQQTLPVHLDKDTPEGAVLLPRQTGIAVWEPVVVQVVNV
jgi:NADH-quinone oxidoreductase subunit G